MVKTVTFRTKLVQMKALLPGVEVTDQTVKLPRYISAMLNFALI